MNEGTYGRNQFPYRQTDTYLWKNKCTKRGGIKKKTIALQVLIPFIPAPRETINRRRSSENPPTVILTIRGLHLARG